MIIKDPRNRDNFKAHKVFIPKVKDVNTLPILLQ